MLIIIRSLYSNQRIDDLTVETWHEVLIETPFEESRVFVFAWNKQDPKYPPNPGDIWGNSHPLDPTPKTAAYRPMGSRPEGDPELLRRFPKLAEYDLYTRLILEASICHRDSVRAGRVPKSYPGEGGGPSREEITKREARIAQCHRECAAGLDTSNEADAVLYMERVRQWFGFDTNTFTVPRGTTFTKKPTKPLALPAPKEPPNP